MKFLCLKIFVPTLTWDTVKLSVGRGSRGVGTIGGVSQGFLSGSWIGVGLDISHFSLFSSTLFWLSRGEALLLSLTRLSLSLQTSVMFTSQGLCECDDSISVSLPQIPCLSCVCKLGPSLIVISSRHRAPSQSQPSHSTGKARRSLIGPELGVLTGGSQWGGCVQVLRYHSPSTRRWEAGEKGTRHRPNHIKIWLRINQGTHRRGRGTDQGETRERMSTQTEAARQNPPMWRQLTVIDICHNRTLHSWSLSSLKERRVVSSLDSLTTTQLRSQVAWWAELRFRPPRPNYR